MILLKYTHCFIAIIFIAYRIFMPPGFNPWFTFICGSVSFVSFIIHNIVCKSFFPGKSSLSLFNIFSLGYFIVFFYFGMLAPFIEDVRLSTGLWFSEKYVNESIAFAAICYQLILAGYCQGVCSGFTRHQDYHPKRNPEAYNKVRVFLANLSAYLLILFIINVGRDYLQGAYRGAGNWTPISRYIFLTFELIYFLSLSIEIFSIRNFNRNISLLTYFKSFTSLSILTTVAMLILKIYTGDRGPIVSILLILGGGYDYFIRKINLTLIIIMLIFGGYAMNFIGNYRTSDASMTLAERVEKGQERTRYAEWYTIPGHFAGSVRTLVLAHEYFQERHEYFYGKIQFGQIVGVFPFLRGVLNRFRFIVGATSSIIFTNILLGPGSSIGVGSSVLADVYIDFGPYFSLIVFYLLGKFIGWLEIKSFHSNNIYYTTTYLLMLSYGFYWSRALLLGNFRNVIWSLAILFFIEKTCFPLYSMAHKRLSIRSPKVFFPS